MAAISHRLLLPSTHFRLRQHTVNVYCRGVFRVLHTTRHDTSSEKRRVYLNLLAKALSQAICGIATATRIQNIRTVCGAHTELRHAISMLYLCWNTDWHLPYLDNTHVKYMHTRINTAPYSLRKCVFECRQREEGTEWRYNNNNTSM